MRNPRVKKGSQQCESSTPKAGKRDKVADNLTEENEENVISEKSLTVDVHEHGRVTFDLTELATNPTRKAGKNDKVADNLSEENEENVFCEDCSLTPGHQAPREGN